MELLTAQEITHRSARGTGHLEGTLAKGNGRRRVHLPSFLNVEMKRNMKLGIAWAPIGKALSEM